MASRVIPPRPQSDFFVRKADLDDIDALSSLISSESMVHLNELFDHPKLSRDLQRSFLSLTVLNNEHRVIGAACFDDSVVGLKGKCDDKHYNLWEEWLGKAYNLQGISISSSNALWLTYLLIDEAFIDQAETIAERLLQNLFVLQPQLDGVLFLRRGEVESLESMPMHHRVLSAHFLEFKPANSKVLTQLMGVHSESRLFYTPKSHVQQDMDIRMAREEDHDDLAEIFNKQSEVLTSQFGEFFIADLIATQNLTRRMTKGSTSQGKAIVGEVAGKAIGLMSISTEIDYNLLNQYFDLATYDSLLKPDLYNAIQNRYSHIRNTRLFDRMQEHRAINRQIQDEKIKSQKVGQRLILQQFCQEKESQIKLELQNIANNQIQMKALDIAGFEDLLKRWMTGFQIHSPNEIFLKYPQHSNSLQSLVMTPSQFFIETLQLFGLPKNYMKKEGHWKDWAKKIIEDNIAAQLRRPKKNTKKAPPKKGRNDKREEDNLKPPQWFDIVPFTQAFSRFAAVSAEVRAVFREEVNQKHKAVLMLFCDEHGEMIKQKTVDLNTLGKKMLEHGVGVPVGVVENMSNILEAFGEITYVERTVKVQEKVEEKKNIALKREVEPKFVEVNQKLVAYHDFQHAVQMLTKFDVQLARLGQLKSQKLEAQVQLLDEKEDSQKAKISAAFYSKTYDYGSYGDIVCNLNENELPNIPLESNNAIVINLFCIDEIFQARSLQFIEFAFSLFPQRQYIIITQPFTVAESSLVRNMIQVGKKRNSTFQHCLYLFHKDSLYSKQIKVRRATDDDLERGNHLLLQAENREEIKNTMSQAVQKATSKYYTFSVSCANEVIGLYTVSKTVNLDYYVSHFFVQDHIILEEHSRDKHAKVIHSFINPLFVKSVRFILKEILRLTNKSCLYFQVHNRTLLPDLFHQFTPLRMRVFPHLLKKKWNRQFQREEKERRVQNRQGVDEEREAEDEEEAPFSLSMVTKKMLSAQKVENNTRIVVVGASDTGLSFIQSLLMIEEVHFTNITLLAPGGIVTMHTTNQQDYLKAASTSYTLDEIRNLMIDARTTVLDAKMVKLDKKDKRIMLDKNAYVPYDILVLCVGLIDTLLQNEGLISYGLSKSPFYKDKAFVQGIYSIDDPYLYQHFAIGSPNIKLLTRRKKAQNITIYGRTPHTIAFVSGLISRGVNPCRIYYVNPGSSRRRTNIFGSNEERIQYQSQLIADPDTFEDINVEKIVIDHLRTVGVNVEMGFQFHQIVGNPCVGIKFRKKADNYQELQELIKNKKAEIQQRLQEMGNRMAEEMEENSQDLQEKISPEKEIEIMQKQQWKELFTPSAFFITSGLIDIDKEIFNIIHENGLVYNGRLIVKSNFQTTEKEIFACGRICEFSQRYKNLAIGKSLRLDRYNGRELGSVLSKQVLEMVDLGYLTTQRHTEEELPQFHMATGLGSALFGSMVYYFIKRTDNTLPKSVLEKNPRSKQLLSKNIKDFKGHYIKFSIDPNGIIEYVSYLGSEQVVVPSLASFIGLSLEYLNKVCKRNDNGLIPDIVEFLSENWAICLYHELFSEFRHYMKTALKNKPIAERLNNRAAEQASDGKFIQPEFMASIRALLPPEIIHQIRQGTIDFIRINRNHLPMYYTLK